MMMRPTGFTHVLDCASFIRRPPDDAEKLRFGLLRHGAVVHPEADLLTIPGDNAVVRAATVCLQRLGHHLPECRKRNGVPARTLAWTPARNIVGCDEQDRRGAANDGAVVELYGRLEHRIRAVKHQIFRAIAAGARDDPNRASFGNVLPDRLLIGSVLQNS